ncbi:uncharacterized protein UHOD_12240 [Ustilago sp. UG-2017b]|nr:uncharacterized protein UHOD_12240 [Ustilago sp. UG-2017b]
MVSARRMITRIPQPKEGLIPTTLLMIKRKTIGWARLDRAARSSFQAIGFTSNLSFSARFAAQHTSYTIKNSLSRPLDAVPGSDQRPMDLDDRLANSKEE